MNSDAGNIKMHIEVKKKPVWYRGNEFTNMIWMDKKEWEGFGKQWVVIPEFLWYNTFKVKKAIYFEINMK